jgi:hypothetical protein
MATAIIELDSLPDAIGTAAQDHHLPAIAGIGLILGFVRRTWR